MIPLNENTNFDTKINICNFNNEKQFKILLDKDFSNFDLSFCIPFILSKDYKKRFAGETLELMIRKNKLQKIIEDFEDGKLSFELSCNVDILKEQFDIMNDYLDILLSRAKEENINIYEILSLG